ncbi:SDR family oxidoreductase [Streptomyces sp. R302]|uniref:SDR family oxidoreductase n=1 Tax=unclassified Streptomyces TaxID=2593676 RepID=UPI00145F4444|nr:MULTISPECIES: SDR family NAD(P)-dependent oxidoreductase [unclassified Streptomyces]NML51804.1 SDR family oxidoreductase [Streptomyces sp. R301]NML81424.1 SDR family oxidoreductase [Streptomyces sp. R302]
MDLTGRAVVVTGAGRGFGRALALRAGRLGARVYVSARGHATAEKVAAEVVADSGATAHAFACDLSEPASIRAFARDVAGLTGHVDVLVNNGARYLRGPDLWDADDDAIGDTVASGATGSLLTTKHFLPLLRASAGADVVNLVSSAAEARSNRSPAHPAFYAAKAAQAGFADVLSQRLRPEGIRVISLYPPDFDDGDPLAPSWEDAPRTADRPLTAQSVVDCVLFAIGQPRDCFIRSFHFEQA